MQLLQPTSSDANYGIDYVRTQIMLAPRPDVRPFELAFQTQILERPRIQEGCNSILVYYESQEIGASATCRSE